MKKKEITIDDLAGMVQRGFVQMDNRFDQVDKRFVQMDGRFDRIEAELKEIKTDISDLKLRADECVYRFEFRELDKRIRKLELKFAK
jgi:SMC interacting uncharacterized protein involved in chromosome segregation